MLYSLPLAPGQKKQIAIVDWERRDIASRAESTVLSEQLDNLIARDRDVSDVVKTTLHEHSHGESDSLTVGSAHGSGVAGGGGQGGASFGGLASTAMSGGYSESQATQDSLRDLTASAVQRIHDQTMQAASSVRNLRTSVIQTVGQGERVSVTTEVVANHNHCHAMTVEYFEVLRHFRVSTELADVKECLYIPLPMSAFEEKKVQRWRDLLASYLRKPTLLPAFDANDRVISEWVDADFPPKRFADEQITFLEGSLALVVRAPNQADAVGAATDAVVSAAESVLPEVAAKLMEGLYEALKPSSSNPQPTDSQMTFRVRGSSGVNQALAMEFALIDQFAVGRPLQVSMRLSGRLNPPLTRAQIETVVISWPQELTDAFPPGSKFLIRSATMRYRTAHMHHVLFSNSNLNAGLSSNMVMIPTPLDHEEMRDPQKEDRTAQLRLIQHLNQHIEYYHKAIWWGMDPDRRFMLLDGYLAPTLPGDPKRSLAAVVDNRLIGFAGNSMVMPVGHGIRMDPTYSIDPASPRRLKDLYPVTLMPPTRISLPTKGVFAEAVMGDCNSCESKDETLFWRWNEVPTGDEPTAIMPPGADSRRSDDTRTLVPTAFPAPMVSIQTAPALPEPTALDSALKVIGAANLFKDITGLDQNQKNALAALQTNAESAKYFAGEASKLAQQQQMKDGGIDKSLQSIKQAQAAGLIDPKQASDLAIGALQGLTGKSEGKPASATASPVKEFIDSAAQSAQSKLKVESGGEKIEVEKSGSTTSSSLAAPVSQSYVYEVSPQTAIQVLRQLSDFRSKIPVPSDGVGIVGNDEVTKVLISDFEVDKDNVIDADRIRVLDMVGDLLNSDPQAAAYLVGRASQTGLESKNLPLSERRALAAFNWLIGPKGVDPAKLSWVGVGALDPIVDRRGLEEPLNRSVEIVYSVPLAVPVKTTPPVANPGGGTKWEIAFDLSWGMSLKKGIAIGISAFELTNVTDPANPVKRSGVFIGGGMGVGLLDKLLPKNLKDLDKLGMIPAASFAPPASFETPTKITFDDFHWCLCRMTEASAHLFLGGSISILSFVFVPTTPSRMNVGGGQGGPVGLNASTLIGTMRLFDP